jgi:hypothetical protein
VRVDLIAVVRELVDDARAVRIHHDVVALEKFNPFLDAAWALARTFDLRIAIAHHVTDRLGPGAICGDRPLARVQRILPIATDLIEERWRLVDLDTYARHFRWFPDVLKAEMDRDKRRDPDKYKHIWLGNYATRSEAAVFRNWRIDDGSFELPGLLGGLVGDRCTYRKRRGPTAILGVENVRVIADASGSRGFLFNVKNVGTSYIDGYGMNFSIISQ